MWQEASVNGTIQKLAAMMDTPPMGLLGVSACNDEAQWKSFPERVPISPYRN